MAQTDRITVDSSKMGGKPCIRGLRQNVLPDHMAVVLVAALTQHEKDLESGALVDVDESKSRVRVLPI